MTDHPTARVFHYVGNEHPHGWYYQFSGQEPEGPYSTALEAGTRAREAIVANSERHGSFQSLAPPGPRSD